MRQFRPLKGAGERDDVFIQGKDKRGRGEGGKKKRGESPSMTVENGPRTLKVEFRHS